MKVFISWSGELSNSVAVLLKEWLPSVLQALEPFVSSEDIEKGSRWGIELTDELEKSSCGIICVTLANLNSDWVNFEAGALSKEKEEGRVMPFLIDLKKSDVKGPLSSFQLTIYEKADVKRLIVTLNKTLDEGRLEEVKLDTTFEKWWPDYKEKMDNILSESRKGKEDIKASEGKPFEEINNEILEEVLDIVRAQSRLLSNPAQLLPPNYLEGVTGSEMQIDPKAIHDLRVGLSRLEAIIRRIEHMGEINQNGVAAINITDIEGIIRTLSPPIVYLQELTGVNINDKRFVFGKEFGSKDEF